MADTDSPRSLGLPTPFGILEGNVLVAGAEAAVWITLLATTIAGTSAFPDLPDAWKWWYALVAFFGVLALFVVGLATEGLAGLTERLLTKQKGGKLRPWYAKATNHPADWTSAQKWIWTSPQAASEYNRRRLRILVARNTAFNVAVFTLVLFVHLIWRHPGASALYHLATLLGGALLTWLFGFVWIDANRAYHRAIADAGEVDSRAV
jgi:MFS family permease